MQETSKLLAQSARLDCLLQFETQVAHDGQSFSARVYAYCDRVKVGLDLRSRPTFKRSHMHSFAP